MYVFDTNVFIALGFYYPSRFPTIWDKLSRLVDSGDIVSVKEVKNELELYCSYPHVMEWVVSNKKIFKKPTDRELKIVSEILRDTRFRGLVKLKKILDGKPVADPFVIASASFNEGIIVTEETFKVNGARIPTVCREIGVECINVEEFLTREEVQY